MWLVSSDVLKREASVQNYTEETRYGVDTNFLIANKDSWVPGTVVWPGREGAYLTFLIVQV